MANIVVFSFDFPYPPNRGGRADIWRKIVAFRKLGHRVFLVCWRHDSSSHPISEKHIAEVRQQTDGLAMFPIRRGMVGFAYRLARLPQLPSHVSSRVLTTEQRKKLHLSLKDFAPDILWTEGPYPAEEALLSRKVAPQARFIYRSHNIEHQYMQKQSQVSLGLRNKFTLRLACIGLKKFEKKAMCSAEKVFDVSVDDIDIWKNEEGVQHSQWLAPLTESSLKDDFDRHEPIHDIDVVFLGNLTTPNNVDGVLWLMNDIYPKVQLLRPGTSFGIAGSSPDMRIKDLFCSGKHKYATLFEDVPSAIDMYRRGRVLVNPVRIGSGIHLKAIEMLCMPAVLVSAQQGTLGMPPEVKCLFRISNDSDEFAQLIVDGLNEVFDEISYLRRLDMIAELFSIKALQKSIAPIV